MYMMTKKLKMAKIECACFYMKVWSKVCFALSRMVSFCRRNKMYKMASIMYCLYDKCFSVHDICYRKAKNMLEAVLKEMEE
uniref:Uncharacterized protein n=1 Tax=Siphoviridae sp. ctWT735 TaxID=2825538 RepID=A0A8S5TU55_9CAUD|nr:MAG TPA: hypothetical protein [Siphoviridae sp. ctWT735]